MKKNTAAVLILALCGAAAFARTSRAAQEAETRDARSVHAVGAAARIMTQPWSDGTDWRAPGAELMYHHLKVRPDRFSYYTDMGLGYSSFSSDDGGGSAGGFSTSCSLGLGGAPVVAGDLVVAVHGTLGANAAYADGGGYSIFGLWTTVGMSAEATCTFAGNLAAFAGVSMSVSLAGVAARDTGSYEPNAHMISPGGFAVVFRAGIAFVY